MTTTLTGAEPPEASIAVLPFNNMSGDPEQDYFSDGITEDIITDLSKVGGLTVVARNSSFAFKGKDVDVRDVGRELGVRSVLEGSVRRAGDRLRITAQLIDAATGGHVWAERYDRDLKDIFELQDEVTREIVGALKTELSPIEEERIAEVPTTDVTAHDLYLKARELLQRSTKNRAIFEELVSYFERAIALDPSYAQAHTCLAYAHTQDYLNRWSDDPDSSLKRADQLVKRAIVLDPNDAYTFNVAAIVAGLERHVDRVIPLLQTALELDPNSALAHGNLGYYEVVFGRPAAAIPYFGKAIQLDPLGSQMNLHSLGMAHLLLGDYATAEGFFRKRIAEVPDNDVSRSLLASALGHLGRQEEAKRVWDELMQLNPTYSVFRHMGRLPFQNPATPMPIVAGLRKAGLIV